MSNIIKSLVVASALVASGAAYANDSGDSYFAPTVAQSQLAFTAQPSIRTVVDRPAAERETARAATSRGLTPINTQNLSRGSNN
jgi:hypothetical protein